MVKSREVYYHDNCHYLESFDLCEAHRAWIKRAAHFAFCVSNSREGELNSKKDGGKRPREPTLITFAIYVTIVGLWIACVSGYESESQ